MRSAPPRRSGLRSVIWRLPVARHGPDSWLLLSLHTKFQNVIEFHELLSGSPAQSARSLALRLDIANVALSIVPVPLARTVSVNATTRGRCSTAGGAAATAAKAASLSAIPLDVILATIRCVVAAVPIQLAALTATSSTTARGAATAGGAASTTAKAASLSAIPLDVVLIAIRCVVAAVPIQIAALTAAAAASSATARGTTTTARRGGAAETACSLAGRFDVVLIAILFVGIAVAVRVFAASRHDTLGEVLVVRSIHDLVVLILPLHLIEVASDVAGAGMVGSLVHEHTNLIVLTTLQIITAQVDIILSVLIQATILRPGIV